MSCREATFQKEIPPFFRELENSIFFVSVPDYVTIYIFFVFNMYNDHTKLFLIKLKFKLQWPLQSQYPGNKDV